MNQVNSFKFVHRPAIIYFGAAFLYTLFTTIIFQVFIFPKMPSISTSLGILKGDNELFHQLALEMANNIKLHGWGSWKLFPLNIAAGINVGILAVFYFLFGARPYLILPLNAFLHALSFLIMFKAFLELGKNKKWAIIAALPFLMMPSSLLWTSQLHKDNYAILAWVLFFYALIRIEKERPLRFFSIISSATFLLILIRPLYLHLTLTLSLPILLMYLMINVKNKKISSSLINASLFLTVSLCGYVFFKAWNPVSSASDESHFYTPSTFQQSSPITNFCKSYKWNDLSLPGPIEKQFKAISGIRMKQICAPAGQSTSTIDLDFLPSSGLELMSYAPRAFIVSQFYPTPYQLSFIRKLQVLPVLLEMLIYYFFFPFMIIFLYKSRKSNIFAAMVFCLLSEIFLAYIIPNMGSYHRIRYPFFAFLLGLGLFSFLNILDGKKNERA